MRTKQIDVTYTLDDQTYRAQVAAATGPVARERNVLIPVGDLTPAARLAMLTLRAGRSAPCMSDDETAYISIADQRATPSAADASARIVALLAEQVIEEEQTAARLVGCEAYLADLEAAPESVAPGARWPVSQLPDAPRGIGTTHGDGYGWPEPLRDRVRALREREDSRRAALAAAAQAAAAAERDAWIEEHGSDRLRAAVRLGLIAQSEAVYRDERLALERPGWRWDRVGKNLEIRNPSREALAALDEARATDPAVQLVYLVIDEETDEDGEIVTEAQRGPALVASFLGSAVIREVDGGGPGRRAGVGLCLPNLPEHA